MMDNRIVISATSANDGGGPFQTIKATIDGGSVWLSTKATEKIFDALTSAHKELQARVKEQPTESK